MKKIAILIWISLVSIFSLSAQRVSGTLLDDHTGMPLPGVSIVLNPGKLGTISDRDGHFSVNLPGPGDYSLVMSFVGYRNKTIEFSAPAGDVELGSITLEQSDFDLGEVIVTATPTGSNVRYQASQVFSGELLQRKQDMSIGLMLDGEPGVSMRSFGPAPARPVIRGFDGDRVLMLENGERMGDLSGSAHDHVVAIEPLATDRIEVVRGPASLLYGSSAIGGVVNLLTQDVPYHWEEGAGGKLGIQGATVNSMAGLFGRFIYGHGNMAYTGRISYRTGGSTQTPSGMMDGTDMRNFEGSLGMGFMHGRMRGGVALFATDMIYGIPEGIDNPDERVEIRLQKQMGHVRIRSAHQGFFDRLEFRMHGGFFNQQEVEVETQADGTVDEDIELEFHQRSISSTLTMQHKPFWIFSRGAAGVNLYGRSLEVGGDDAFTPGDKNINVAAFVFEEIPLARQLRLQFGIRGEFSALQTLANEFFPEIDESRRFFNWSGSAGIHWKPSGTLEFGMQMARAFKNPSLEELFAFGPHLGAGTFEIGDASLGSETTLGADMYTRFEKGAFHAELAAFYTHVNDFIIFTPTGEVHDASGLPVFRYEADEARIYGGEFSSALQLHQYVTITGGIDYVIGERLTNGGEPLPFMPPLRSRAGLTYDREIFWVGTDFRYVTAQNRVAPDEETTPGYFLAGAEAGFRFDHKGRHMIQFRVHNILNTSYRDHLSRIRERANPMPGRNFSLGYHWNF